MASKIANAFKSALILCMFFTVYHMLYLEGKVSLIKFRHFKLLIPFFGLDSLPVVNEIWPSFNGTLKPHDHDVVPNIAHFIWFTCHPFDFINLLSIVSVHRYMKPDKIFFHTDCEPVGRWWEEVKTIPTLVVKHRHAPTKVFGLDINPKWPEHQADVSRLEVLLEHGGAYFDLDVLIFDSLDKLRRYDYVATTENRMKLNTGIILASKSSTFLAHFYETYKYYDVSCYDCNSILGHNELARKYQGDLHIETDSFIQTGIKTWIQYFHMKASWEGFLGFHIWDGEWMIINSYTPDDIQHLDNPFGEMCRHIYYGNTTLIPVTENEPTEDLPQPAPTPWYIELKYRKDIIPYSE